MNMLAEKTYALLRKVPEGRVTTYKALADALGCKAYRAIGQFMRHNPFATTIPCHRVIAANGTIGGFMGQTSGPAIQKKIAILRKEGVKIEGKKVVDFKKIVYLFR